MVPKLVSEPEPEAGLPGPHLCPSACRVRSCDGPHRAAWKGDSGLNRASEVTHPRHPTVSLAGGGLRGPREHREEQGTQQASRSSVMVDGCALKTEFWDHMLQPSVPVMEEKIEVPEKGSELPEREMGEYSHHKQVEAEP